MYFVFSFVAIVHIPYLYVDKLRLQGTLFFIIKNETKYSKMDQVKFVERNLQFF